jgi:hypothetical protein
MMQFDPASFANATPVEPSLKNLAIILRNKQMWPQGFEWDYTRHDTCAIGLARQIWGTPDSSFFLSETFNVSEKVTERFFLDAHKRAFLGLFRIKMSKVTPERVANLIDRYLETGKC